MNEDQILARIAVLEYVSLQAFVISLKNTNDPHGVLTDAAEHFAKSFKKANLNERQKEFAEEAASRLFVTARANLEPSGESTN